MKTNRYVLLALSFSLAPSGASGVVRQDQDDSGRLTLEDVFQLEFASNPEISPDGSQIVFVRNFMDIMKDRQRSNLWIVNYDGSDLQPITTGNHNYNSPRWSPDGKRLLYASNEEGSTQLYVRWIETGQVAKLTQLTNSPGGLTWSPDGNSITFSMFVPSEMRPLVTLPQRPEGAEWAQPPRFIESVQYRADGKGFVEEGHTHMFVLPAEGGTPRQVTSGSFNHGGTPSWTPDSKGLVFSANRHDNWEYEGRNSEVYELSLEDGSLRPLTDRYGPDNNAIVSPTAGVSPTSATTIDTRAIRSHTYTS